MVMPALLPAWGSLARTAVVQSGAMTLGGALAVRSARMFSSSRPTHDKADALFLTTNKGAGGSGTAPVLLGLMSTLSRYVERLGYFRPIGAVPHNPPLKGPIEDPHVALVHSVFKMKDDKSSMTAVSQEEALALLSANKEEELTDRILTAYEKYKKNKSFVVVEGAALPSDAVSFEVNSRVAKMFELPVFLSMNCENETNVESVLNSALLTKTEYDNKKIQLQTVICNKVDPALVHPLSVEGKKRFEKHGMSLAGILARDRMLGSVRLNEIASALSAQMLYGQGHFENPDTDVSQLVAATRQLPELLNYIHKLPATPGAGPLIFTSADRLDILTGLLYAAQSTSMPQVAGIVLTGGMRPPKYFDEMMQGLTPDQQTLPVMIVEPDTFQTATIASKVKANILPTSSKKIDHAIRMWNDHVDSEAINRLLSQERLKRVTPKLFQHSLVEMAKRNKQHVVLPEGEDKRILQAAAQLLHHNVVDLTILGVVDKVNSMASTLGLDLSKAKIVDPATSPITKKYAQFIYDQRKSKGVNEEMAMDLAQDLTYFGTCMVATGDADGMVSGAIHTTANTVRPALQLIKSRPDRPVVSSVFFMLLPDKVLVYGDCAINVNPTSEELAQIALTSAETAVAFGIDPKVAMLSYATGDSNSGPLIDKVRKGAELAKEINPSVPIEGPIQYDAAVDMSVAKTKVKGKSDVAGQANVLIFPDLNTGNNTYKAVQQATGAIAMGPLLQGLRKPVNDLSRGCTPADIYNTVVMTALQAIQMKNTKKA
eukprot:comp17023_c0_seq1/m.15712 comp17023_c0_seq1/g.15712  ORF comp17023_c0_seq1/g.15712 comp17023_c0_seq1/m.15712 type:complete len:770 (-) comp17023_c0_seq1:557-2866(-)